MAESGGPTTQSGILYQNSIAALYLGRMLDETPRHAHEQVVEVRLEAPTHVDDIVVSYQDGHQAYIQAKENIQKQGKIWREVWQKFYSQFTSNLFDQHRDRLVLHLGRI